MPIESLTSATFECLKRFSEEVWCRPCSEDYYRWRYLEAPDQTTLLATDGDRCVATVSALLRRYPTENGIVECFEPFDWYALPAMKGFGVGARIMKALMEIGKPIIAVGGSEDTLRLLPRLGFKKIGAASEFFLPLTGRYILRNRKLPNLIRHAAVPLLNRMAPLLFKPRKPAGAYTFSVQPEMTLGAGLDEIDGPEGFRSIPDPRFLDWIGTNVGAGKYFITAVNEGDETVAWFLCRLYDMGGLLHGAIIDIRLKRADTVVAVNVLRGAGRILAKLGVDDVRAFTTSEFFASAYRQAGYRESRETIPAMLWSGKHLLALDHIALSCSPDEAIWPLEAGMSHRMPSHMSSIASSVRAVLT